MKTEEKIKQTAEDVLRELRSLVNEAEKVLGQNAPGAGAYEAALAAIRDRLAMAQERATELYQVGRKKTLAGARFADETIRENPYQTIAVALSVGLLVGVLLGRNRNSRL